MRVEGQLQLRVEVEPPRSPEPGPPGHARIWLLDRAYKIVLKIQLTFPLVDVHFEDLTGNSNHRGCTYEL